MKNLGTWESIRAAGAYNARCDERTRQDNTTAMWMSCTIAACGIAMILSAAVVLFWGV